MLTVLQNKGGLILVKTGVLKKDWVDRGSNSGYGAFYSRLFYFLLKIVTVIL